MKANGQNHAPGPEAGVWRDVGGGMDEREEAGAPRGGRVAEPPPHRGVADAYDDADVDAPDHLREEVVAVPVPGFGLGTLLMPAFALFLPVLVAVAATAVVHLANNLFKLVLVGWKAGWTVVVRFALPAAAAIVDAPDRDDGGDARDQRSPLHRGDLPAGQQLGRDRPILG